MKTVKVNTQTNLVENVSLGAAERAAPEGFVYDIVEDDIRVARGYTKVSDGVYSAPQRALLEDLYVPRSITRRQCAIELRERGMITPLEALNMTKSAIPPAMIQVIFDAMSETDKILAETDFAADTYLRSNELLNGIISATGATKTDIDNFFISAAER